jgi:hypothetical protein
MNEPLVLWKLCGPQADVKYCILVLLFLRVSTTTNSLFHRLFCCPLSLRLPGSPVLPDASRLPVAPFRSVIVSSPLKAPGVPVSSTMRGGRLAPEMLRRRGRGRMGPLPPDMSAAPAEDDSCMAGPRSSISISPRVGDKAMLRMPSSVSGVMERPRLPDELPAVR